jgi:hypothetical protein
MIDRARRLLGDDLFEHLLASHERGSRSKTPPSERHRLIVLVTRVQRVLNCLERDEKTVDPVAFGELHFALGLFERWERDWPGRRLGSSLKAPHVYRHAFALLAAADHLSSAGNDVEFLKESEEPTPDLRIHIAERVSVDTEVKAPRILEYPRQPLTADDANRIVEQAVKDARGRRGREQLARRRDAVLIIGGIGVMPHDIDQMKVAASREMSRLAGRGSRFVGIGISSPFVGIDANGSVVFVSAARFALNDAYEGRIHVSDTGETDRFRRLHDDEVRFGPAADLASRPRPAR